MHGQVSGTRTRCRPKHTWLTEIGRWTGKSILDNIWEADNRTNWEHSADIMPQWSSGHGIWLNCKHQHARWPVDVLDWSYDFVIGDWFDCHATQPDPARDIGTIEVWLSDWWSRFYVPIRGMYNHGTARLLSFCYIGELTKTGLKCIPHFPVSVSIGGVLQTLHTVTDTAYCYRHCILLQKLHTVTDTAYCYRHCILLQTLHTVTDTAHLQTLHTVTDTAYCYRHCTLLQNLIQMCLYHPSFHFYNRH